MSKTLHPEVSVDFIARAQERMKYPDVESWLHAMDGLTDKTLDLALYLLQLPVKTQTETLAKMKQTWAHEIGMQAAYHFISDVLHASLKEQKRFGEALEHRRKEQLPVSN